MRLQSGRRPYDSWIMIIGLLILGGLIATRMKGYTWLFGLIPVSIVIGVSVSRTFTLAFVSSAQGITVEYMQYLKKRTIDFEARHIHLVLERYQSWGGTRKMVLQTSFLLKIISDGKVAYMINSDDGFLPKEMLDFVNAYNSAQASR